MIVVTFTLAAMWLVAGLAPETRIGQAAFRLTVERPAHWLAEVTTGHVLVTTLLLVGVGLVAWAGGTDGVRMLAMAAPDAMAWLAMVDAASLAEAMVLAVTAAIAGWPVLRRRRVTPRVAKRRRRTPRPLRQADNDDDSRPALRAVA